MRVAPRAVKPCGYEAPSARKKAARSSGLPLPWYVIEIEPRDRPAFGGRPGRPRRTGAAAAPESVVIAFGAVARAARRRLDPAGRRRETSGGPRRTPNFEPTASMTFFASSTGFFLSIACANAIAPGRSMPRRLRAARITPALITLGFTLNALPIAALTSRSVRALFFLSRSKTNVRIPAGFVSISVPPQSTTLPHDRAQNHYWGVPSPTSRAHATMPPSRLTASNPCRRRNAATDALRPPLWQAHTIATARGSSPTRLGSSPIGMWTTGNGYAERDSSSASRTSSTTG